jgi:molybdate transport system ATP-binding protein
VANSSAWRARALARRPDILLLDEPFSAVDRVTRRRLRRELMELRRELSMPVILVTHDLDDVIRLADRMCVLQGGRILQTGAVEAVMARPASPTVAELLDLSGGDGATQQMTAPPTM